MKQNVISAIEGVNQTMKMIEQYQLQLLRYENMLHNSVAPAAYVWNSAQLTTMRLMNAMNTLQYYRNQARQPRRLPVALPEPVLHEFALFRP